MGIPVGARLTFNRDATVEVIVVEPKRVEYGGEAVGLSRATKELLGSEWYVAPQPHWSYGGRSLTEIYDETYPATGD